MRYQRYIDRTRLWLGFLIAMGMAAVPFFFAIAVISRPGIILSAVCFYFIVVWRSAATP